MGVTEPFKRWRRSVDFHSIPFGDKSCRWYSRLTSPSRRVILFLLIILVVFFYFGSSITYLFYDRPHILEALVQECLEDHIHQKYYDHKSGVIDDFVFFKDESDSNIQNEIPNKYSPIVGNGAFGVSFYPEPLLYLKEGRTLILNTGWSPIQSTNPGTPVRELYHTNVFKGTVNHFQCMKNGLRVSSTYFAHRTIPYLFYRDIAIYNPTDLALSVEFNKMKFPNWQYFHMGNNRANGLSQDESQFIFSGLVKNISTHESIALCVAMKGLLLSFEVPPHRTKHLTVPVIINSEIVNTQKFINDRSSGVLEQKCNDLMKILSKNGSLKWEQDHTSTWQNLWKTGLTISQSKAAGALNTDHINATVYYVLSNVPMNKNQTNIIFPKGNITSYIPVVEGCYGGYHHTLQAINLWRELKTYKTINDCVNLWLLTLEKQGCHKLLMTGADGIVQAMILSFGGFRFSPHHLELKIDPKFLHRDYQFRNIEVDYNTYINVSVILQENNKAVLAVTINRAEKDYWACDGGCIDEPVKLSQTNSVFPVKITEPSTSILYITPDRNHMELIKDTLHVHKIVEAPAHDHHVLALHRHGSHLGGLPIMFWATVITLIVIFHLFLCKLICNEYCGKQDKIRNKYSRVPSGRGV